MCNRLSDRILTHVVLGTLPKKKYHIEKLSHLIKTVLIFSIIATLLENNLQQMGQIL